MENAARRGAQLMSGLRVMQQEFECLGDVRGLGLMVGVELVRDRASKQRAGNWRDQVVQQAFRKGLLLLGCGVNTIRFCPALTVSEAEIDVGLEIFRDILKECQGACEKLG